MLHKISILSVGLLIAVVGAVAAEAQYDPDDIEQNGGRAAVSGSGVTAVRQTPTRMMMCIQLFGKGKTPEEALAKLKERREAAVLQLEALKADKNSIRFGDVSFAAGQEAQKKQLENLIRQQLRAGGKVPKGLKIPKTTTLNTTLIAEWPLEVSTQEELLLRTRELAEQIVEADVSGVKEAEKLSPEEAELAEEARQMMSDYDDDSSPQGKPTFIFVAEISQKDREKAMAGAFAKAKAQAAELARAAGVEPGKLIGIAGGCAGEGDLAERSYSHYGRRNIYADIQEMIAKQEGDENVARAYCTTPGKLTFRCHVTATFAIGK